MKHFKDISFWCIVLGVVVIMVVHHILSHKSGIIEGQQNDTVKCGSTEDEETGNPCCDYDLWYEKNQENEKCRCPATVGNDTDGIFTTDSKGIQYGRVDGHVDSTALTSDPRCSNASLTTDKPTGCDKNNRFVDETIMNNSTHFRCLTPTEVNDNILDLARSLGIEVNAAAAARAARGSPSTLSSINEDIETRKNKIDNYDIDITGKTGADINQAIEDEEALRSKYCLDVNASSSTLIDKKITARARLSLSEDVDEAEYDEALEAHAANCTYFNLNDEFEDCSNFSCSIDGEGGVNAAGETLDVIDSLAMNLSENPCCPHESNPIPNDGCISTLVADGTEEFWEYTYDDPQFPETPTNAGPYCRFFAESNPCAADDSDVATCEFKQGGQCTETPADCETRIKEKLRVKCVDENLITDQNCPTLSDCETACTWDKMNDAKNARLRGEINSNIAELNTFLEEAPSYEVSNGGVASYPFSEIDECQEEDLTASPAVGKETNGACDSRRLNKISTINELCRAQVPPQNTQGSDALIQCEESDILTIVPLYEFTSHTFTNCGKTGRQGPTLSDCMTAYGGSEPWNNTNFFNVTGVSGVNGIQVWTVPDTGIYKIIAKGAREGLSTGKGAIVEARFPLIKGDKYMILIGQQGNTGTGDGGWWASGGGGGTFMVKGDDYTNIILDDALIVAGGAGGTSASNSAGAAYNVGQNGIDTQSTGSGGGSTSGSGVNGGSGGAGLISNGDFSNNNSAYKSYSFKNGGEGGGQNVAARVAYGGFGGGGSAGGNPGGGGGGFNGGNYGYSGWNPNNRTDYNNGGRGGGSYVNPSRLTPPTFSPSTNDTHGSLEIVSETPIVPPRITALSDGGLYSFSSHTFTNCTSTGVRGPTLANCQGAVSAGGYGTSGFWQETDGSGNQLYFGVTGQSGVNHGIQWWKVPATGDYDVDVYGASGGSGTASTTGGGQGARIKGRFTLTKGDYYWIVVGQRGMHAVNSLSGGGGGGGSFFVKVPNNVVDFNTSKGSIIIQDLLIAAGGGGGSSYSTLGAVVAPGQDASGTPVSSNGAGGAAGATYGAGGGGGFIANGAGQFPNQSPPAPYTLGYSFKNSASQGGAGDPTWYPPGISGGFGGGGGSSAHSGGGGGGANGGNGPTPWNSNPNGKAGTSYIASGTTASVSGVSTLTHPAHGQIIITAVGEAIGANPGGYLGDYSIDPQGWSSAQTYNGS